MTARWATGHRLLARAAQFRRAAQHGRLSESGSDELRLNYPCGAPVPAASNSAANSVGTRTPGGIRKDSGFLTNAVTRFRRPVVARNGSFNFKNIGYNATHFSEIGWDWFGYRRASLDITGVRPPVFASCLFPVRTISRGVKAPEEIVLPETVSARIRLPTARHQQFQPRRWQDSDLTTWRVRISAGRAPLMVTARSGVSASCRLRRRPGSAAAARIQR
jgi:hypothetical protein